MTKTRNRAVALLLACLQIVLLLVTAMPQAKAEGTTPAAPAETPALNETITGSMQFGSFGTTAAGDYKKDGSTWDGCDYTKAFIYSDDYFSAPAFSAAPTGKQLTWDQLENTALVTASMDFAQAAFGSNEEATDEADYADGAGYAKNAEAYLEKCKFDEIVVNNDPDPDHEDAFNKFPTRDSIGYVFGLKTIHVWDPDDEVNKDYQLIAIGVRGGGYGAEWASNLTLGESGRHKGFDDAAQKVLFSLRTFLVEHNITADDSVKYWITGYSRGGAVANLVAGDISANKGTYFADKENIYGYTFEAPAGAVTSEDPNGTNYPNIHNIVNLMDPVPRVSCKEFDNIRLGVDYYVPDYHNAESNISDYYNAMYSVLKTLAVKYGETDNTVLEKAHPDNYPLGTKQDLYYVSLKDIKTNMGLTLYQNNDPWFSDPTPWQGKPITGEPISSTANYVYQTDLDDFMDRLVKAVVESRAWDYNPAKPTSTIINSANTEQPTSMTHRALYNQRYQEALRTLIGLALGKPGSKLSDLASGLSGAVSGDNVDALSLYTNVKLYDYSASESRANNLVAQISGLLKSIIDNLDQFSAEDKETAKDQIDVLAPVLTRLYLYDRYDYGSQYLGTMLKYASSVLLVPHTAELVAAWNMALDENYTSDYRSVTLADSADIKVYEFRDGLDEEISEAAVGALVAEYDHNAETVFTSLDQRITYAAADGKVTITFPANLDLRFDVTTTADLADVQLQAKDLAPVEGVNVRTNIEREQDRGNITASTRVPNVTERDSGFAVDFNAENASPIALDRAEVLSILSCRNTSSLVNNPAQGGWQIFTVPIETRVVAFGGETKLFDDVTAAKAHPETIPSLGSFDFDSTAQTLSFIPAESRGTKALDVTAFAGVTKEYYAQGTWKRVDVIPATNVYYEDSVELVSEKREDGTITSDSCTIRFYGTGIDAYCVCDSSAGWVNAQILHADGTAVDGVDAILVGNNYKNGVLYNVPTVHFEGLGPDTYILRLTSSSGKKYHLTGVRVYNESHADPVESKLAMVDEGEASYVNVRDLLLHKDQIQEDVSATSQGAVFFTGDPGHQTISDYETIGPKRELYLMESGQGVAFSVSQPGSVKVEIGLRSADGNSGAVKINGSRQDVTSVDSYYTVTPVNGNVIISFDDECSGQIAVTYIKLTAKTEPAVEEQTQIEPVGPQCIYASASLLSFVNEADPSAEPTPTPTPEPTADPISEVVNRLISEMVARLFQSISKLFGAR